MINQNELIPSMVVYKTVSGLKYILRTMSLSPSLKSAVSRSAKRPFFIVEYGKLVESFIRNNRSVVETSPDDIIMVCTRCNIHSQSIDEILFQFKLKDYLDEVNSQIERVDYDPA